jgi:hypothetical protein
MQQFNRDFQHLAHRTNRINGRERGSRTPAAVEKLNPAVRP